MIKEDDILSNGCLMEYNPSGLKEYEGIRFVDTEDIFILAANLNKATLESLYTKCRKKEIIAARRMASYVLSVRFKLSNQAIADIWNIGMDRTNVNNYLLKANNYIETDKTYKEKIEFLYKNCFFNENSITKTCK